MTKRAINARESTSGHSRLARLHGEPPPSAFSLPDLHPAPTVDVAVAVIVVGYSRLTSWVAVAVVVLDLGPDVDNPVPVTVVVVVVVNACRIAGIPKAMFHTSAAFCPARPE